MMNLHHIDTTHRREPIGRTRLAETSTVRENIYEHRFLAEIGEELLARGIELEIMRGEIDRWGHDIVLEAGPIIRHTQLKVMVAGGARTDITVNTRLLAKPSACVVWLVYEPDLRTFVEVRWFGGAPGQALPDLGTRLAKHSRANSKGVKAERSNQRKLGLNKFERLADLEQLCDRLFGLLPADPLEFLRSRMSMTDDAAPRWVREVMLGDFHAIPEHLDWNNAASLAGLVDGYRILDMKGEAAEPFLARQRSVFAQTGHWLGDAVDLWVTLFLELRADRMGANDLTNSVSQLDTLCRQLRSALVAAEANHA